VFFIPLIKDKQIVIHASRISVEIQLSEVLEEWLSLKTSGPLHDWADQKSLTHQFLYRFDLRRGRRTGMKVHHATSELKAAFARAFVFLFMY
jgi:hypothetical protein